MTMTDEDRLKVAAWLRAKVLLLRKRQPYDESFQLKVDRLEETAEELERRAKGE